MLTMKKHYFLSIFIFALLILFNTACKKTEEVSPEESFAKIYDNGELGGSFLPVDVEQTADGGYLILGEYQNEDSDFYAVYLMKTDAQGNFLWEHQANTTYVNPISELIKVDTSFYFLCMDRTSLATYVMQVQDSAAPSIVQTYGSIIYPLAVSQTPDAGYLLQSYDRNTRATRLSKLDASFNISWENTYPVLEQSEELLIEHLTKRGTNLPFFTGSIGEGSATRYFFNGFNSFTFSMLFVNTTDGQDTGVLNGVRYKDAISSAVSLSGNQFALTMFKEGQNFVLSNSELNTASGAVASIGDLEGNQITELSTDAQVVAKKLTINDKEVIIFASDTKSNQIVLYAYDAIEGTLLGTKYLGFYNPYEVAGFTLTEDNGLAVLGTSVVMGRFPRIALFKLSSKELSILIGS